ncbi:hypothetical protein QJS66_23700 (plasmid) [Kocuria rhizophila]|nr:hypothetical protein QJS66_23700 [Kocuria rhizophila]
MTDYHQQYGRTLPRPGTTSSGSASTPTMPAPSSRSPRTAQSCHRETVAEVAERHAQQQPPPHASSPTRHTPQPGDEYPDRRRYVADGSSADGPVTDLQAAKDRRHLCGWHAPANTSTRPRRGLRSRPASPNQRYLNRAQHSDHAAAGPPPRTSL